MEENKNISFKHSLESYNKKYRNRRERILKYTKKQVEEFDLKYQGKVSKNFLLKGRKWTLIGDTYYEIPKAPTYKWFRNLKASTQVITCALLGGGLISAVAVPTALALHTQDVKPVPPGPGPEPEPEPPVEEKFIVTFKIEEQGIPGAEPDEIEVKKGNKIAEPEITTVGKTLVGWFNGNHKWDFDNDVVESNIELKAKFSEEKCKITYDLNGGKYEDPEQAPDDEFPLNSKIDKPKFNPTHDSGYGFLGWTKTKDGDEYWDFDNDKTTSSTLTLYAKWQINNVYTVNFYSYDYSEATPVRKLYLSTKVIEGNKVTKPTNPEQEGYQFKYWKDTSTSNEFNFSKTIDADTELEAVFAINVDSFEITGDHNIDCDRDSESLTPFDVESTSKKGENSNLDITWTSSNDELLKITKDATGKGIPTVDKSKMSTTGSNKVTVTATIKVSSGATATNTTLRDFEVEIGSFDVFNQNELANGRAIANDPSTISGDIYIPSRYHDGSNWVDITKIGENAFLNCVNTIKVFIPIPTIIIESDAFKSDYQYALSLSFADTTNTWFFGDSELDPSKTEDLNAIISSLKSGNSSEKAPTCKGLKFTLDEATDTYSVCLETDQEKAYDIKNLLIPAYYYWDGEGHTKYNPEKSKKVTKLDTGAFKDYTVLESVTFHSQCNLDEISEDAFNDCQNLKSVYFDNNADSKLHISKIGSSAFANCKYLEGIVISNTVTEISGWAFNSSGLKTITIPGSVKTIGMYAFQANPDLTTINIANKGLYYIESGAFKDCTSLTQFKVPYTLYRFGYLPFVGSDLKSIEFIDDTSEWISSSDQSILFNANKNINSTELAEKLKNGTYYCSYMIKHNPSFLSYFDLTKTGDSYTISNYHVPDGSQKYSTINIPANVVVGIETYPITCIATDTFKNNSDIQKINIPDTVTRIETDVFNTCSNLTTVYIPSSVNFIGKHAFRSCNSLTYVEFEEACRFKVGKYGIIKIDFTSDSQRNALLLVGNNFSYISFDLTKI